MTLSTGRWAWSLPPLGAGWDGGTALALGMPAVLQRVSAKNLPLRLC